MTDHSRIEGECAQYLAAIGFLVIRTHSSRNPPVENGIADMLAIRKGNPYFKYGPIVIAVEIKAGRDKLRADQEAWLSKAREQGVMILVVRSLDELQEAVPR
jgi:Holliday junction resolvase